MAAIGNHLAARPSEVQSHESERNWDGILRFPRDQSELDPKKGLPAHKTALVKIYVALGC
jgi:hypothetical protein